MHVWTSSAKSERDGGKSGQDKTECTRSEVIVLEYLQGSTVFAVPGWWRATGKKHSLFAYCDSDAILLSPGLIYKQLYLDLVKKLAVWVSRRGVGGGCRNADGREV